MNRRRRRLPLASFLVFLVKILKTRLILCSVSLVLAIATFQNVFQGVVLNTSSSSSSLSDEFINNAVLTPNVISHNTNNNNVAIPKATNTVPEKEPEDQPENDKNKNSTNSYHYQAPPRNKKNNQTVIYSYVRADRSGAAIQDMLMCQAYAFHNQFLYGGACTRDWNLPQYKGKRIPREQLLRSIGLSEVLPLDCPKDPTVKSMNRQEYIQHDTGIFTNKYVQQLQALVEYPTPQTARIAVHVRRGDITPCRPRTRDFPRYLPNQHYLKLIDRYNNNDPQQNSSVVIYSESESFEPFDAFRERGYQVVLDGDIGEVWKGIISSDVAILSRSSFSLVPAVIARGKVVYTPFWHQPLPHWDIVDDKLLNETSTEFKRLKKTCPNKKGKKKKTTP